MLQCCNSTRKFCNSLLGSVFINDEAVLETLGEQLHLKSLKRHFVEVPSTREEPTGCLGLVGLSDDRKN